MARTKLEPIEYIWRDKKRILGIPMTFTKYMLSDDRLFIEKGLLNLNTEEVLLYRIRDIQLSMSLWQRIFGVGTVCIYSSDKSSPHVDIENVKDPRAVKELIHRSVETAKDKRRMRSMEVLGDEPFDNPHEEMDFDPDDLDNLDT